jgi:ribosome-interacting GTPase 1
VPESIKKKMRELENEGINVEDYKPRICFEKKTISVEGELGWFEPP